MLVLIELKLVHSWTRLTIIYYILLNLFYLRNLVNFFTFKFISLLSQSSFLLSIYDIAEQIRKIMEAMAIPVVLLADIIFKSAIVNFHVAVGLDHLDESIHSVAIARVRPVAVHAISVALSPVENKFPNNLMLHLSVVNLAEVDIDRLIDLVKLVAIGEKLVALVHILDRDFRLLLFLLLFILNG